MLKRIALFLCFVLPALLFAQKQGNSAIPHPIDLRLANSSFATIFIGNTSDEAITAFIKKTNAHFRNCELRVLNRIESRGGSHVLFSQNFQGIPVFRGDIKVNTDTKGNIKSMFDNSYFISSEAIEGDFASATLIQKHIDAREGVKRSEVAKVYFPLNDKFISAQKITLYCSDAAYYEEIMDGAGNIIYTHDLNSYYKPGPVALGPDSLVSASVFLPDPITSAAVSYGSPYVDNSDTDVPELNNQRVNVNMRVYYGNDTFSLKSPYALIAQFSAPDTTPPAWFYHAPNFHFMRSVGKFEDVNAFYHISTFHAHIQSMGFNNIVNYQIKIDTHALNGQDNSIFSPANSPHELMYGEGGVDDAEDADVIIHEYGHAISESAAPGTNTGGTQRQSLDEANGDYFASSYSRGINPYRWSYVFGWDGHNAFWTGRDSQSPKTYNDLTNSVYADAEIWSSAMMEIWGDLGAQITDADVIESMYSYASGISMPHAARLLIQADSTLFGGVNYSPICYRLSTRKLYTCVNSIDETTLENGTKFLNAPYFSESAPLTFYLGDNVLTEIQVYNLEGKLMLTQQAFQKGTVQVRNIAIAPGVYFIRVINGTSCTSFKAVRL